MKVSDFIEMLEEFKDSELVLRGEFFTIINKLENGDVEVLAELEITNLGDM
jgi:hypothetical protein